MKNKMRNGVIKVSMYIFSMVVLLNMFVIANVSAANADLSVKSIEFVDPPFEVGKGEIIKVNIGRAEPCTDELSVDVSLSIDGADYVTHDYRLL